MERKCGESRVALPSLMSRDATQTGLADVSRRARRAGGAINYVVKSASEGIFDMIGTMMGLSHEG